MPCELQLRSAAGITEKKEEDGNDDGERSPQPQPTPASKIATLAPGVAASVAVMTAGWFGAGHLGMAVLEMQGVTGGASPISGIPVAVRF